MPGYKTIDTYVKGYTLSTSYAGLVVEPSGTIGGEGLLATVSARVENNGTISPMTIGAIEVFDGVDLQGGGLLENDSGGVIRGSAPVVLNQSGIVENYGDIISQPGPFGFGVELIGGGSVINGGANGIGEIIGGVQADAAVAYVSSLGVITGSIQLLAGGGVQNGAYGYADAQMGAVVINGGAIANLTNYGDISGGVRASATGVMHIKNGGGGNTTAAIRGLSGVVAYQAATITNFGDIAGDGHAGSAGVYAGSGSVTNGAGADRSASVVGYVGVKIGGAGTVTNFGTIQSNGEAAVYAGVVVGGGGHVYNGSVADTAARIEGYSGVAIAGGAGTVVNYGAIVGDGGSGSPAVGLAAGGRVLNGSGSDTTALISGVTGIDLGAAGTVANFGTVDGLSGYGAILRNAATLTNGNGTDRVALIEGAIGVELKAGGAVANFGTIRSLGAATGAYLSGGAVTNGTVTDTSGLIEGYDGLRLEAASASNFGTILGQGAAGTEGAYLGGGSNLTNRAGALVEGYAGVSGSGSGTVTNFGTIEGLGGTAVAFGASTDALMVEAGSVFEGKVLGGGGTLDLASGAGVLSGLFTGGVVTVSGSMPTTTFTDFGTVEVGAGASFTMAGNGSIAAGQSLIDAGGLTEAGVLGVSGSLSTTGTLAGAGTLALTGGTANFGAGTALPITSVTMTGATTRVGVNASLAYAGKWVQSAGALTVATGATASFTGGSDSFAGTLAGAGTVALSVGADSLTGLTLAGTHVNVTGAAVTVSGAIVNAGELLLTGGKITVASAGASLTGTTVVMLSDNAANEIVGATAGAVLTNVGNHIEGAGKLGAGQMTFVNQSAGWVASLGANALILDTGTNTIANAGVIEAVGIGGLIIDSAVANTGRLIANASTLTVNAAVTGTGYGEVITGRLKFASTSTFNQNVTFVGTGGALELAHGQTYSGTITGFSTTAGTFLDLDDISFTAGTTTAIYSGAASGGILTVSDGSHTAHIHLAGNYTASSFITAADGHGGTVIHDPTKGPAKTPPPSGPPHLAIPLLPTHTFIQIMASLGAHGGEGLAPAGDVWRPSPMLAMPGARIA